MGATHSTTRIHELSTPSGTLKGLEVRDKTTDQPIYRRYTRVPYALPPVGPLRWRRPQPLPEDFTFNGKSGHAGDYTSFGPICPQPLYEGMEVTLPNPDAAKPIENVQDEDCLYLNIWVPVTEEGGGKARGSEGNRGWPVEVYIHGGWLQVGNANQTPEQDPFDLLANTSTPRIIIAPTYRLNLFGFMTSSGLTEEDSSGNVVPSGNYGFWDQRMALEWIHRNIQHFGGDPENITVGGLSAGANSTVYQLYYDTNLPPEERVIKRVYLRSNAVGIQPNSNDSEPVKNQFNEVIEKLGISSDLDMTEKTKKLREVPAQELVSIISKLKMHTFRATTDDDFIASNFLKSICDGSFTAKLKANGTTLMIGEVSQEGLLYRLVNPPTNHDDLILQLENYYPARVVKAVLKLYDLPRQTDEQPTTALADAWADLFGQVAADCQVYAVERGFVKCLLSPPPDKTEGLGVDNVFRYRIAWRAKALDRWLRPDVGVCHASDGPIWWCSGWRAGFTDENKKTTRKFLEAFDAFLKGGTVEWRPKRPTDVVEIDKDGRVHVVEDEYWERGQEIWRAMCDAQIG